MRAVQQVRQQVEQLKAIINTSLQFLLALNIDVDVINGELDVIIEGMKAVHVFYEQVDATFILTLNCIHLFKTILSSFPSLSSTSELSWI